MKGDAEAGALLTRAAWTRALALAMAWPGSGHASAVCAALERPPVLGNPELDEALAAARAAWRKVEPGGLACEYMRLFSGTGPCPPHETCYGDARRLGGPESELADISGFYAAFGIEPTGPLPDLPDHLAAELEFLSSLLIKDAYALVNGWEQRQRVTREAARAFCEQHLGRWVSAFREAVEAANTPAPYRETARAIESLVRDECARLTANPLPVHGRAPAGSPEPFTCPHATESSPA